MRVDLKRPNRSGKSLFYVGVGSAAVVGLLAARHREPDARPFVDAAVYTVGFESILELLASGEV